MELGDKSLNKTFNLYDKKIEMTRLGKNTKTCKKNSFLANKILSEKAK